MGRRKKKWTARPYESAGQTFIDQNGTAKADTCAQMYESMLVSSAYISLTSRQKVLYLYIKAQLYGKRKPSKDYPADTYPDLQSDDCFYFCFGTAVNYGLYARTSRREFYNDIKALIEKGFIEVVMSGRTTRTKSVYRYSYQWKYW